MKEKYYWGKLIYGAGHAFNHKTLKNCVFLGDWHLFSSPSFLVILPPCAQNLYVRKKSQSVSLRDAKIEDLHYN